MGERGGLGLIAAVGLACVAAAAAPAMETRQDRRRNFTPVDRKPRWDRGGSNSTSLDRMLRQARNTGRR